MASKPTFVLVPGNFLPPAYYSGVVKLLESHSFATRLITLKSTGSNEPLSSNKPDVIAIRETIEHLVEAGKDAIIVAHSYAGVPTCEAVKGLGKRERLALGKTGGVVKLVFVTAWVLQEGETPLAVIERNSMEATWARFDVCLRATFSNVPTSEKLWHARSSENSIRLIVHVGNQRLRR